MAVIGSLQFFTSILKIWLQSIQAFDQTEYLILFDRISIAVTADDNTETCDRMTASSLLNMTSMTQDRRKSVEYRR
jgi:hypothetical protein